MRQESDAKLEAMKEETERLRKESDARLEAMQKKTDRMIRAGNRRMKKLEIRFNGQWGRLMESLVKGKVIKLLRKRDIEVVRFAKEVETEWEGKPYEFDFIAINDVEVVVGEVKTTLNIKGMNRFIKKLRLFKKIFPEYQDRKVYGAVAYLRANQGSEVRSQREGLFVIRATGNSARIINEKSFKPKAFQHKKIFSSLFQVGF